MKIHQLHLKYLGYIKTTKNPSFHYPDKVSSNLLKLNNVIPNLYWMRDYKRENIISRTYIPENLSNLSLHYYDLILYITKYFDSVAIWRNIIPDGTNEVIRTIEIVGYYNDQKLAFFYLSRILDTMNYLDIKKSNTLRNSNKRQRNLGNVPIRSTHAKTVTHNFLLGKIELLSQCFKRLCSYREKDYEKFRTMMILSKDSLNLNYRNYKGKNQYFHALCRKGKYQKNRIIS